jgi:hypothetical protein
MTMPSYIDKSGDAKYLREGGVGDLALAEARINAYHEARLARTVRPIYRMPAAIAMTQVFSIATLYS